MTGYGALAKMMVSRRNQETFRKFKRLNTEIMLHQQAELMHLEMVIEEIRKYPGMNEFDRRWIESPEKLSETDIEGIFERSRELLAQYHSSALQTSRINALQVPRRDELELRRHWYDEESGGNDFLYGVEAGIFREEEFEADLMVLQDNGTPWDPLATFLGDKVVPLYHRLVGHKIHRSMPEKVFDGTWEYTPEMLIKVGNTICMLLSAVIPALSILVLFSVQSMAARLTAICLMSLIFSLVMSIIAQRRADVFMSTTAFAAVLVVFVGSSADEIAD